MAGKDVSTTRFIYALAETPLSKPNWFCGLKLESGQYGVPVQRPLFARSETLAKKFDNLHMAQSFAQFLNERGRTVFICIVDAIPETKAEPVISHVRVQGLRSAAVTHDWPNKNLF